MMLNSKQLEELESLHDTVSEFDDEQVEDADGLDEGLEGALAWRRGMIENALANVKNVASRFADFKTKMDYGTLLFDKKSKRFCRVIRSVPNFLHVSYVSGGEDMFGDLSLASSVPMPAIKLKAPEKIKAAPKPPAIKKPTASDYDDDFGDLNDLGDLSDELDDLDEPLDRTYDLDDDFDSEESGSSETFIDDLADLDDEDIDDDFDLDDEDEGFSLKSSSKKSAIKPKVAPKATVKPAAKPAPKKKPVVTKPVLSAAKPAAKMPTKMLKTGKTTAASSKGGDPKSDPNNYIKQNYIVMSNKELAVVTGLSEHTIRRKLGEWGLKRPQRLGK